MSRPRGSEEYFHDRNGKKSQKRLITFLAFCLLGLAFLANLFYDKKVDPTLVDAMWKIVGIGIGAITAEQFGNTPGGTNDSTIQNQPPKS